MRIPRNLLCAASRTTVSLPLSRSGSVRTNPTKPVNDTSRNPAESFSDADLELRRQQIRRGLRRANTAGAVVLAIVIGLSLAALVQALRAERNARAAKEASARGEQELWRAHFAQAGA